MELIKKKVIRKAIAMFQTMAEAEDKTKYLEFWRVWISAGTQCVCAF